MLRVTDYGVDTNSPLRTAAKSFQREDSLEIDIHVEHGTNTSAKCGEYGNALQAACRHRRFYSASAADLYV
jgi:hypothetical protein